MDTEIIWFKDCSYKNKHLVGGKCSSLGELHSIAKRIGFSIGDGFALSIDMYDDFIKYNELENKIETMVNEIDTSNIRELEEKSKELRNVISQATFTKEHTDLIFQYLI